MDTSIFIGTWWSLVPPLLAIILALVTKEVYLSLIHISEPTRPVGPSRMPSAA